MVSEFVITNKTTQESATFGQDVNKDYLYKDDGLDWGYASGQHSSYSYPGQIGSNIYMTNVREREINFVGYVYYVLNEQELLNVNRFDVKNYVYTKIKEKKVFLNGLINPMDYLRVTIGDYYIEGKPSQSIVYGNTMQENNMYFCQFLISIWCNNPMFKKNTIMRTVLKGSKPSFHFPLIFPNAGMIMSERIDYLLLAVDNEGDTEIGGNIILTANGEIQNPSIENISGGQIIRINKTMVKGEKIIITTNEGEAKGIKGILNGEELNYFKYWDYENDWIKFPKGTSLIGYTTENDSEKLLDVSIELNPEKLGLEEM